MSRIITLTLALISINLQSQFDFSQYVNYYDSTGFVKFIPQTLSAGQPFQIYQDETNDILHTLVMKNENFTSSLNMWNYKYQEYFKGLPVEAAYYVEHEINGYLDYANFRLTKFDPEISENPSVSEQTALAELLSYFHDSVIFAWEIEELEIEIKLDRSDPNATWYPSGELLWSIDNTKNLWGDVDPNRYKLAWRFEIFAPNIQLHRHYYIDAQNASVLKYEELTGHDGPAGTVYYGPQTIDTRCCVNGNEHYLHTDNLGRDLHTKHYDKSYVFQSTLWSNLPEITDDDDDWNPPTTNPIWRELVTHWTAQQSWIFFETGPYNWLGFDNLGTSVRVLADGVFSGRIHYDLGPTSTIEIGSRLVSGGSYYVGTLDVVGHEYTHGILHEMITPKYENESGAITEALCDIYGCMIDRENDEPNWNWQIAEIPNEPSIQPYRDLSDPNILGHPDTYLGPLWQSLTGCSPSESNDWCYIYDNCNVLNYWFYLLSEGGQGVNGISQPYNVFGIGHDVISEALFDVLKSQSLTPTMTYNDMRVATVNYFQMLYGPCDYKTVQV